MLLHTRKDLRIIHLQMDIQNDTLELCIRLLAYRQNPHATTGK